MQPVQERMAWHTALAVFHLPCHGCWLFSWYMAPSTIQRMRLFLPGYRDLHVADVGFQLSRKARGEDVHLIFARRTRCSGQEFDIQGEKERRRAACLHVVFNSIAKGELEPRLKSSVEVVRDNAKQKWTPLLLPDRCTTPSLYLRRLRTTYRSRRQELQYPVTSHCYHCNLETCNTTTLKVNIVSDPFLHLRRKGNIRLSNWAKAYQQGDMIYK